MGGKHKIVYGPKQEIVEIHLANGEVIGPELVEDSIIITYDTGMKSYVVTLFDYQTGEDGPLRPNTVYEVTVSTGTEVERNDNMKIDFEEGDLEQGEEEFDEDEFEDGEDEDIEDGDFEDVPEDEEPEGDDDGDDEDGDEDDEDEDDGIDGLDIAEGGK